jgi:hypothetical protein
MKNTQYIIHYKKHLRKNKMDGNYDKQQALYTMLTLPASAFLQSVLLKTWQYGILIKQEAYNNGW